MLTKIFPSLKYKLIQKMRFRVLNYSPFSVIYSKDENSKAFFVLRKGKVQLLETSES